MHKINTNNIKNIYMHKIIIYNLSIHKCIYVGRITDIDDFKLTITFIKDISYNKKKVSINRKKNEVFRNLIEDDCTYFVENNIVPLSNPKEGDRVLYFPDHLTPNLSNDYPFINGELGNIKKIENGNIYVSSFNMFKGYDTQAKLCNIKNLWKIE